MVIPCLNEAATVGEVVRGARAWVPRVIVVDDGSTDGTAAQALEAGATVCRRTCRGGKGAAIHEGIHAAGLAGYEWVLLMDGDGQHAPGDIPSLLTAAERTRADLVIGNRMDDAASIPWLRRRVNRWMSRDLSRWLGLAIPDSQSGFRLLRVAAWERANPSGDGFVIESEMIVAFAAAGLRIADTPVRVLPRFRGRSRIQAWRDTVRWWRGRRRARAGFKGRLSRVCPAS